MALRAVVSVIVGFTAARAAGQSVESAGASAFPPDSAIIAMLQQRVNERGGGGGIVVGLLEPNGERRILAWGERGPGQPPLDGESVFEIGSITKVFTGTLLADMVLKGEVSLDDPIQKYLPAGQTSPTRNGIEITLGMLSEQNSGLPRLPDNWDPADRANPYANYGVDRLYDFLTRHQLRRDPGETFEYSNVGVGLLGHVLELRAGKTYEELVQERILRPLGMTLSGIALSPGMRDRLALGHAPAGIIPWRNRVVPNWDFGALAGAGAIRSTANDMLTFLEAGLHSERSSIHEAMAFAQQVRRPVIGELGIGLNWISMPAGPDTIVFHNGGTAGYRTFAGIVRSRMIGVVVLMNVGGEGADDIGLHLLVAELPLAPSEVKFRVILIVGFMTVILITLSHRIKSWSLREKLDRAQEGPFILATLRPVGLMLRAAVLSDGVVKLLWLGVIAYMINPAWIAWSSVRIPAWLRWTGVAVFVLGGALFTWTLRSLGANLTDTVVTRRAHTLVTRGPYRWVRHPFYDAMALLILAISLITANWVLLVIGCLVVRLLVVRTRTEEEKLLTRFGDDYRAYALQTGRFLPKSGGAAALHGNR